MSEVLNILYGDMARGEGEHQMYFGRHVRQEEVAVVFETMRTPVAFRTEWAMVG